MRRGRARPMRMLVKFFKLVSTALSSKNKKVCKSFTNFPNSYPKSKFCFVTKNWTFDLIRRARWNAYTFSKLKNSHLNFFFKGTNTNYCLSEDAIKSTFFLSFIYFSMKVLESIFFLIWILFCFMRIKRSTSSFPFFFFFWKPLKAHF